MDAAEARQQALGRERASAELRKRAMPRDSESGQYRTQQWQRGRDVQATQGKRTGDFENYTDYSSSTASDMGGRVDKGEPSKKYGINEP